jgi:hypothetical protein
MRPVLEGAAMQKRFVRILLVVALGTALASAALTPPAVAQEPSITASLTGAATLVAKGAAVDVAVAYSCSPDTTSPFITVQLTQRVSGGHLATGSGAASSGLVCDGTVDTTTVRVFASGERAFKKGDAVGVGTVIGCSDAGCFETGFPTATVRVH